MNPGTFQGAGTGALGGSITKYTQTPVITSSQTIPVPNGVQRIEALLVGGGGGGGNSGAGGGFGGAGILEIPVTGSPLQVVIGAGGTGASPGNDGSPTYIVSAGTRYAEIGGGGGGNSRSGRSSGGGGGGFYAGGSGGPPPVGRLLWSPYNNQGRYSDSAQGGPQITNANPTAGGSPGILGSGGGGGAGSFQSGGASDAGQGGGGGVSIPGPGGSGGAGVFGGGSGWSQATTKDGGSLTALSIWGLTGFAGGTAATPGTSAGGGGGLLGAGSGATGGNGGGGGGGASPTGGTGGNGCAIIRFYF